jgi:hypothetical protein
MSEYPFVVRDVAVYYGPRAVSHKFYIFVRFGWQKHFPAKVRGRSNNGFAERPVPRGRYCGEHFQRELHPLSARGLRKSDCGIGGRLYGTARDHV